MRPALALAALLALAPAAALADPAPPAPPTAAEHVSGDCARARAAGKTCVLDMTGETVDGGIQKADNFDVMIATFSKHGSLVKLRKDFIAEIVKTAEDL